MSQDSNKAISDNTHSFLLEAKHSLTVFFTHAKKSMFSQPVIIQQCHWEQCYTSCCVLSIRQKCNCPLAPDMEWNTETM